MEIVIHEGKAYKKVDRPARAGDTFLILTDESPYMTVGKVYEITSIDSDGDPRVNDNDGDDTWVNEGDYAILEPVDPTGPITLLSVTPPIEKTYTLVVTDGFLERIEDALAHLGDVEAHALITQIREQ